MITTKNDRNFSSNKLAGRVPDSFQSFQSDVVLDFSNNPSLLIPCWLMQRNQFTYLNNTGDGCTSTFSIHSSIPNSTNANSGNSSAIIGAIIGVVLLVIVIILGISVFVLVRKRRANSQSVDKVPSNETDVPLKVLALNSSTPLHSPTSLHSQTPSSSQTTNLSSDTTNLQSQNKIGATIEFQVKATSWEIEFDEITIEKQIGSGNFGQVFKGNRTFVLFFCCK